MDKLSRSKALIALLLTISSCTIFNHKREPVHVEVLCSDLGLKILIRNTTSAAFWEALEKFHNAQKERGSSDGYTALIFRNKHSMQFKNIKPEDMMKCVTRDAVGNEVERGYAVY